MVDTFSIFFLKLKIHCQDRFQKLRLLTDWIFCLKSYTFLEWITLLDQNSNNVENFKIKLDDFRKKNCKKKNLRGHFGELSDDLFN